MQDKTTIGISDTFREYITELVKEVVINGEPFEAQKKWLRKNSEAEGLNYETIESNLNDLFEAIKELEEHESKFAERSARALAKDCYLSEALVNKLIEHAAKVRIEAAERATNELNGHEYVDLGLPSRTLWATCNVGADNPEDYGNYFSWDEGKTAAVHWGNGWGVPSKKQWEELEENTKSTWTRRNGVNGRLFTANNENSLFLPASGYRSNGKLYGVSLGGFYWSSSLFTGGPNNAWYFNVNYDDYNMGYVGRYYGFIVRPVRQN